MDGLAQYLGVASVSDVEKLLAFATGAGFSVVVAVWFMVRDDRRLKEQTACLHEIRVLLLVLVRGLKIALPAGMRDGEE